MPYIRCERETWIKMYHYAASVGHIDHTMTANAILQKKFMINYNLNIGISGIQEEIHFIKTNINISKEN